ncbi:MAG: glycosyltransferase family 39 protein [Polyangiaceae bacterium]
MANELDTPENANEVAAEGTEKESEAAPTDAAPFRENARASGEDVPPKKASRPRGNPLRKSALVPLIAGIIGAFLLMAKTGQLRYVGVPLGLLFVLIAAFGALDFVGSFDDIHDSPRESIDISALAPVLGVTIGSFILFAASVGGAALGIGSGWLWGLFVAGTFIAFVASIFNLGVKVGFFREDESGASRPLLRRHGFWLLALASLLYFPALGIFSLWDPWETHYGEVAREILARDDWISLWWAQDGWFWSKPILNFWIQALSMATLGAHYEPDGMLIGGAGPGTGHPEWIVRTPNVLMTILAMYVIYKGVSKVFGRRAGLIGGIVLATMPDWYFLAHQTMTDMPCVSAMTAAMGLLMLGLNTDEDQKVKLYEVTAFGRTLRWSAWHLVFGVILVCALPQILYLASRNITLVLHGTGAKGFSFHWDEFRSGSAGNCGLPGNESCHGTVPSAVPVLARGGVGGTKEFLLRLFLGFEPFLQALIWAGTLGSLLWLNWGERRVRRLFYLGAWFAAAIATMGKGPMGVVIPGVCAFAYVATKRRWAELTKLEVWSGFLIVGCVALPWFVSMYVRHGAPFTDRLIFHDMFNRTFGHVHDTNEGDDTSFRFYVWQLGYALFPWTGLVPIGLVHWLRRGDSEGKGRGDMSVFLVMWFVIGFGLFSFMGTKFHHYIFPVVPPAAMLLGIVFDSWLGTAKLVPEKPRALLSSIALAALGSGLLLYGVSRLFPGSIIGYRANATDLPPAHYLGGGLAIVLGVAALFAWYKLFPAEAEVQESRESSHEGLMLGAGALGSLGILLLLGRDLTHKTEGAEQPGAIRLLQLFTYNYRRPWPSDSIDFTSVLLAVVLVAGVATILLSVKALRRHAVILYLSFATLTALWGLDVYMVKTAPHWGQRELLEAYYKDRRGTDEQIVAYQMNWKGENFYTSNRIPAFVSSGATFTTWLKQQKDKGQKVMYFVTEHSRMGGLRSEVGAKSYREVTDRRTCNKFVLVRAEL